MQLDLYSVYEAMNREHARPFSESVARAGSGKVDWELGIENFADHMPLKVLTFTHYCSLLLIIDNYCQILLWHQFVLFVAEISHYLSPKATRLCQTRCACYSATWLDWKAVVNISMHGIRFGGCWWRGPLGSALICIDWMVRLGPPWWCPSLRCISFVTRYWGRIARLNHKESCDDAKCDTGYVLSELVCWHVFTWKSMKSNKNWYLSIEIAIKYLIVICCQLAEHAPPLSTTQHTDHIICDHFGVTFGSLSANSQIPQMGQR